MHPAEIIDRLDADPVGDCQMMLMSGGPLDRVVESDWWDTYRVWPDGTVQLKEDPPYDWMSDDYRYVQAASEEHARYLADN